MDEREIIHSIKNHEYSILNVLADRKLWEKNETYRGFCFFILQLRGDNTTDILDEIVSHYDGLSNAYYYLGTIANKINSSRFNNHMAEFYFRKSVETDPNHAEAWWSLYRINWNVKCLYNCLVLLYKDNEFKKINNKILNAFSTFNGSEKLTKKEWDELRVISSDERVYSSSCASFIVSCFFYLGLFNNGLELILASKKLDYDILNKYFEKNIIDIDMMVSKTHLHNLEKIFGNDHIRIYQEYVKELDLENSSVDKKILIYMAFKAKQYSDVINHYTSLSIGELDSKYKICFLISLLYVGKEFDIDLYKELKVKKDIYADENQGLYLALDIKLSIDRLRKKYEHGDWFDYDVSFVSEFKDAKKLLNNEKLINNELYGDLYDELKTLKDNWNEEYYKRRLSLLKNNENNSYNDFIEYCKLCTNNKRYDDVITTIVDYHDVNPPTIDTHYILGFCYEEVAQLNDAFKHYEISVALMEEHRKFHYHILSDYIECAKKISYKIPEHTYNFLRDKVNVSLVDSFKLGTFTAKNLRSLFKYYPLNVNTLDALSNQYFYFPSKGQLNDPIEFPRLKNIGEDHLIDSSYNICSLSNNENSMLMWSHYTQEHQGIMVEYEFRGELPSGVGIEPVKYINKNLRHREKDKYIFNQFLLTKNDEWKYEKEVRLISYKRNKIYYDNYDYLNSDRNKINAIVSSITLGCMFDESKKQLIINMIASLNEQRKDHEPKIRLRRAIISESNSFELKYVDIDN